MNWPRAAALGLVLALAWAALRSATPRRGDPAVARWSAVLGARLSALPPLRRPSRDSEVTGDAAVAPGCWPARWSGAGADLARAGERLAGLRALLAVAALAAAVACVLVARPLVPSVTALAGAGAVVPDLVLRRHSTAARRAAAAELPLACELLAASLDAGADLATAVTRTSPAIDGPLASVLRRVAAFQRSGSPAAVAVAEAAELIRLPVLDRVGAVALRSSRLGVPLAPALRGIADDATAAALNDARSRQARRGPVATLITALVVAPPCMAALAICVVGGAVSRLPFAH